MCDFRCLRLHFVCRPPRGACQGSAAVSRAHCKGRPAAGKLEVKAEAAAADADAGEGMRTQQSIGNGIGGGGGNI